MPSGMKRGDFYGLPVPDGTPFARITVRNGTVELVKERNGAIRMLARDRAPSVKGSLFMPEEPCHPVLDEYACRWLAMALGSLCEPMRRPGNPPPSGSHPNRQ